MSEVNQIATQLKIARDFYYNGRPIMTDPEFDDLENKLRELDPNHTYFNTIGSNDIRGIKIKHKIPMGSLEQVSSVEEINNWVKNLNTSSFVITSKLDGNSINIEYDEDGNFYRAATRGDGIEGLDITRHIRRMFILKNHAIPQKVSGPMTIRAEAIFNKHLFNETIKGYKNPRNYVGGQLNRTIADEEFLKNVSIVAFDADIDENKLHKLALLWGESFEVVKSVNMVLTDKEVEELPTILENWKENLPYEIDGLVIDINDKNIRNSLGYSNLNPNFARKFKINKNFVETEVIAVEWNPSKNSLWKPRVKFEPVDLAGVTISFATGFNAKFIKDNNIGPGAIIKVQRRGDVIPMVTEVITPAISPMMPEDYENLSYWTETGVDLILKEKPDESFIKELADFFSSIDVPMLKIGNVSALYEAGFTTINSIISASEDDLVVILGENGYKAYNGLREKLSNIDEYVLAGSLPFFGRGVGKRKMKVLAENYGDLSTLTYDKIINTNGFDEITAIKIANAIPFYTAFLEDMKYHINIKHFEKVEGELSDVAVCFTGVRSKELEKVIASKGGKILSSITKDATHLVAKDPKGKSTKLDKARKSGVIIISLDQANEMWNA